VPERKVILSSYIIYLGHFLKSKIFYKTVRNAYKINFQHKTGLKSLLF